MNSYHPCYGQCQACLCKHEHCRFHHPENHDVSSSHLNLGLRNRQVTCVSEFRVPTLGVCSTEFEFLKREFKGQKGSACLPHERCQGARNSKLKFCIMVLCKEFQQHFSVWTKVKHAPVHLCLYYNQQVIFILKYSEWKCKKKICSKPLNDKRQG